MTRLRVLELFAGIGGFAAALGDRAEVVAAIDIHAGALDVYRSNHKHHALVRTIESISAGEWSEWDADLWWVSPPCQPFTRRGLRRDADDPRTRPLLSIIDRIREFRPRHVALENVPGFDGSETHARWIGELRRGGYSIQERLMCPTELGVPNRRRRYYMTASLESSERPTDESRSNEHTAALGADRSQCMAGTPGPHSPAVRPLREFLDESPDESLFVADTTLADYVGALHVVDAEDPSAVTACFTSAYGRSPVRSGSYVRQAGRVRRFSPREILRLLGFPATYRLPPHLGREQLWRLVGNSLSVDAVRTILRPILGDTRDVAPRCQSGTAFDDGLRS